MSCSMDNEKSEDEVSPSVPSRFLSCVAAAEVGVAGVADEGELVRHLGEQGRGNPKGCFESSVAATRYYEGFWPLMNANPQAADTESTQSGRM